MTRDEIINLLQENGVEAPAKMLVTAILNAQNEMVKSAKAEAVAQTKEEFKDFVKKEDYEALNKNFTDKQKEFEDYKNGIVSRERTSAIESAIKEAKGKNAKAIMALLDSEKIVYKDGKVEGLEDQLKALRENDTYLFEPTSSDYTGGRSQDDSSNGGLDFTALQKL